ncbi:class I SAM-dependent methyltransferase [Flavobacteriaceae bacterium]|nr:class I SAM-dependent methyltransferase [Flavobacteriaceae bacterium]MDC0133500.1 class I SAM-dependent methyltransferase [Flavobacteriaceae bacterium]
MIDPGSFRDPSGHIIHKERKVFRIINYLYKDHYDHLMNSGLYDKLIEEGLLITHEEVENSNIKDKQYKTLEVKKIPFISYPYEWSFSQLKDALLLTLKIQKICIDYNMTLKDATPFNIQFLDNKPIFIDTLSFEVIKNENYTWKPYKQFCEMFFGTICLMRYVDPGLNKLLINNINGIPFSLINKLLPFKKKLNLSIFTHLVIPNIINGNLSSSKKSYNTSKISKSKHLNILNQIEDFILNMKSPDFKSEWGNYNEETISEKEEYFNDKQNTIKSFLENKNYNLTWDIGSNDGYFSRVIANDISKNVISFDIDWRCVDRNYLKSKEQGIKNVFPLILDLSNPTPSIGWLNQERSSVFKRFGNPDLITCFAVIHHIINTGIPLEIFIQFLSKSNKDILIEYVPLSDPKCQIIFESRGEDFIYPTQKEFEKIINTNFNIISQKKLDETNRILFLIRKK